MCGRAGAEKAPAGRYIFWHWGDIDYGGFRIFVHLRDNCLPDLKPLHMDTATLVNYRAYGLPFSKQYARKLRRLAADARYRIFHPLLDHMLEHNLCLEQECVPAAACFKTDQKPIHIDAGPLKTPVPWKRVCFARPISLLGVFAGAARSPCE